MPNQASLLLFSALSLLQIIQITSQELSESINATGFPNQNQSIYGGWIQVDEDSGSSLFYNLFSKNGTDINTDQDNTTPLILYLEGGPGASSVATAFAEIGPYKAITNDLPHFIPTIIPNPGSWAQDYHLLVIDSPVGVGFSVSENNYTVTSADQGSDNLITFFIRFFELYPTARTRPFYITGRSYGAKFASILAYKWIQTGQLQDITLSGVILACGLVEPSKQLFHADVYYSFGVLSQHQRDLVLKNESKRLEWQADGNWAAVGRASSEVISSLENLTGGVYFYNLEKYISSRIGVVPLDYIGLALSHVFLANPTYQYRNSFNIPESFNFSQLSTSVVEPLIESGDYANSTVFAVEYLLDQGVDVLILTAQLDGCLPSVGVSNYVNVLDWNGAEKFHCSERKFLSLNDSVIVSYQKHENLNFAVVSKAGHYVTYDQPQYVLILLDKFINNKLEK